MEIDELEEKIESLTEQLEDLNEYKEINELEILLKQKFGEDNLKFFQDVIDEDKRLGEMARAKWEKVLEQTKKELKKKKMEETEG